MSPTPPPARQLSTHSAKYLAERPSIAHRNAEIDRIAEAQDGLVHHDQLVELGFTDSGIHRRANNGRMRRVQPKVLAVGSGSISDRARVRAILMSVGGNVAVARESSAHFWKLQRTAPPQIHVVTDRRHIHLTGAVVHTTVDLQPRDVVVRHGMRFTTVSRTLFDLGWTLEPLQLAKLMYEADFRRRLNIRALRELADRTPGQLNARRLSEALHLYLGGSRGTRSDLESTVHRALAQRKVLGWRVNVPVQVADGTIETDIVFEEAMLAVEIDGHGHSREHAKRIDEDREQRLRGAGWTVIRIPQWRIDWDLDDVIRRICTALELALGK